MRVLILLVVLGLGCSGAPDQAAPVWRAAGRYAWAVRAAPDAPVTFHGAMTLVAQPDGTLAGELAQPAEVTNGDQMAGPEWVGANKTAVPALFEAAR